MPQKESNTRGICRFPDCTNTRRSMGLCCAHWAQQHAGKPLTPLRPKENAISHDGLSWRIALWTKNGTVFARISAEDVERVRGLRWLVRKNGYVTTPGNVGAIRLHRFVLNAPEGAEVDHINGDKPDNRRENLRLANRKQQGENQKVHRDNKCGVRGVSERNGRFRAVVTHNYRQHCAGTFGTKEEAAEAAKALRARLFAHHNEDRC